MMQVPKIGAFVLETLTTGMYTNPLDTIREFVQNSVDSILQAEDVDLITRGEGRIEVKVNPKQRTLVVRDNGIGIQSDHIQSKLINIGMSDKKLESDAGFRGIGRLAAIAYCKRLRFCTSAAGEKAVSSIEIDCEGLRKAMSPSMRQVEELADVMAKFSQSRTHTDNLEDHFFEVVMEEIPDTASSFLDWKNLEKYLGQVAPVKFDAQRFVFAPIINDWIRTNKVSVPSVTLLIRSPETEREVFKPYRSRYKTQKYEIKVKDICFFPNTIETNSPFWVWYAKTDLLGTINDDLVAGMRFRKNNISIGGPEKVAELFGQVAESYYRFNSWYIGEIHINSSSVIPNARRDGFEISPAWQTVTKELLPFVKERCTEAYKASQGRNTPTAKVVKTSEDVIKKATQKLETGFVSEKERITLLEELEKTKQKAKESIQQGKTSQEKEQIEAVLDELSIVQNKLEEEENFTLKKLRSNLDRKQRKVVTEILQILYETLDETNYNKALAAILAKFQLEDNGKK